MLLSSDEPAAVYSACALFGFSVGNVITFPALIVSREYGPAAFGIAMGLSAAVIQIAYALGPGLLGALRDLSGGYGAPVAACIALDMAAGLALLLRRQRV
jgi:predicted MFS family arabinose efflux permease